MSSNISRQREGQLRAELEAQRAKVLKLKQDREEGLVIQREVESSAQLRQHHAAPLGDHHRESGTSSNVSLLTSAAPDRAVLPQGLPQHRTGRVCAAALLGVGVTLAAEAARPPRATSRTCVNFSASTSLVCAWAQDQLSQPKVRALAAHQRRDRQRAELITSGPPRTDPHTP